jgi:ATP-dependent Clp protease ATP-binding subunit ClpA
MRIIDIELYKLNDNLKRNETEYKTLNLKFDKSIKEYIFKNGIDEDYGARPLKRCIEKEIATPLARKILSESTPVDSTISIVSKRGKINFVAKGPEEAAKLYATEEYQAQAETTSEKPL